MTISFLDPIKPGLEKNKFLEKLQSDISEYLIVAFVGDCIVVVTMYFFMFKL